MNQNPTMTTASVSAHQVASAVAAFALDGRFPDSEDVASLLVTATDLGPAVEALDQARAELEVSLIILFSVSSLSTNTARPKSHPLTQTRATT